jgi:hypothetical protein
MARQRRASRRPPAHGPQVPRTTAASRLSPRRFARFIGEPSKAAEHSSGVVA